MVYRSTMDVPTRYQWDADSRFPLPDPGTAPGNCGITCVTVAEMFYNDEWHGIYTNRRLVTTSTQPSSTIGEQSQILWKRGVPNVIDKPSVTTLHSIMASRLRPIVLGLDFSRVPYTVAGHPFRGSHSIMLRSNAAGGFIYLDPNFNRTYRTDPKKGYRFMPDWVLQTAYYNVPTQWAIIPTKDKLVPSLPDTSLPSPDGHRASGDPAPMKWTNLVDKGQAPLIRILPRKPIRAGYLTSDQTLTTSGTDGRALRAVGRIKAERLPDNQKQYGRVYLCPLSTGGDDEETVFGYVKEVDIRG